MSRLTLVVAATTKNGIGLNGGMPWRIPKDLEYFQQVTTKAPDDRMNAVFMGRVTWESIPQKFRPLKKRINAVLSRSEGYELFPQNKPVPATPTQLFPDLKIAVDTLAARDGVHRLFIIGGSSLYQETLNRESSATALQTDRILLTRIFSPEYDCDVLLPDVVGGAEWRRASNEEHSEWVGLTVPEGIQRDNGVEFEFQMWVRSLEDPAAAGGGK
ncbi:hypothetical protein HYDPIDRAFT_82613 [Hydnomerulius pinastri MD-312]|nr:hypothetical protein HYDPIDRAFT_82613 [Hydnomerulius pinastri MD-312]